jgi:hypothetical protein
VTLFRIALGASLLALAAACATPVPLPVENVRRPLLTASQEKIATTEVLLPIRQKDIYVYANIPVRPNTVYYSSGGGVAGAIGVALGSAIGEAMLNGQDQATREAAEATARPVRAGLAGFSFDETLTADLRAGLAQLSWLNADGYRVLKEVSPSHPLGPPVSSGRLIVSADYRLSEKADELIVTLTPYYYFQERPNMPVRAPAPAAPAPAVPTPAVEGAEQPVAGPNPAPPASWTDHLFYTNVLSFRMRAANANANQKDNSCEWAFNNAANMRAALQLATSRLTQMLVADLQEGPAPLADAGAAAAPEAMTIAGINGVVISRDDRGALVRLESGAKAYVANPFPSAYTLPPGAKPPCGALPKPAAAKPAPKANSTKRSS